MIVSQALPTIGDILAAAQRLRGSIVRTPSLPSLTLSRIAGCSIVLKFENHQFTASFKERGALNKLLRLSEQGAPSGVCAVSAGNHAQGLAYHAARLGIPATIVMPAGTPMTKIVRTREHGARVIVDGATLEDAMAIARREAEAEGLAMVHPYDDPDVIAGQGTMGLELLEQCEDLDAIVVPIGGGGLISGVAIAIKSLAPTVEIIGVQASAYPSMIRAVADLPALTEAPVTIAEGIAVKQAGLLTRRIVREKVDRLLEVDEASIERAVALLQSVEKTVVEGAGAAALAAVLEHRDVFEGRRVAIPLTGGNIDGRVFASVIMRELVREGQLVRLEVPIRDQPGALAKLTTIMGEQGANILEVAHDRLSLALNAKGASLSLIVQLQGMAHRDQLIDALHRDGFAAVVREID
ncbi:threonine ammonia-lyase [Sphingomonas turrisvirgatae]|uniref:Threonine ammonia-lyase n=1 Tax=Sphingomonas turrisvirgatae TaxID=1888892 RepID=A0A1E3LZ82_9SPHN|nr:threonine ammonia-lyase [Sphingomonas turrisvirgatae]